MTTSTAAAAASSQPLKPSLPECPDSSVALQAVTTALTAIPDELSALQTASEEKKKEFIEAHSWLHNQEHPLGEMEIPGVEALYLTLLGEGVVGDAAAGIGLEAQEKGPLYQVQALVNYFSHFAESLTEASEATHAFMGEMETLSKRLEGMRLLMQGHVDDYISPEERDYTYEKVKFVELVTQLDSLFVECLTPELSSVREDLVEQFDTYFYSARSLQETKVWRERIIHYASYLLAEQFKNEGKGWFPCFWQGELALLRLDPQQGAWFVHSGTEQKHFPFVKHSSLDVLTDAHKDEERSQQFIQLQKCDAEKMRDPLFFQYLLGLNVLPQMDRTKSVHFLHYLKGAKGMLNGKIATGASPISQDFLYKKPLRHEAFNPSKTLTTTLYYHLCQVFDSKKGNKKEGRHEFKRLKLLWETHLLCTFFRETPIEGIPLAIIHQHEDLIDNLKRGALKLQKTGGITDEELKQVYATCLAAEQRLLHQKRARKTETEKPVEVTLDFFVEESAINSVLLNQVSYHGADPAKGGDEGGWKGNEITQKMVHSFIGAPAKKVKPGEDVFQVFEDWIARYENVLALRGEFRQGATSVQLSSIYDAVIRDLLSQLMTLEAPRSSNKGFWSALPEEKIVPVMQQIDHLHRLLYRLSSAKQIDSQAAESGHSSEETVGVFLLNAIADKLARRLPESRLEGFPSAYSALLFEMQDPDFIVLSGVIQEKLHAVVHYFNPEFSLDQLNQRCEESFWEERLSGELFTYYQSKDFGGSFQITDELLETNTTLKFFRQFLNWDDPEVATQLLLQGIDPAEPLHRQVARLMADDSIMGTVIPPSIMFLRQMTFNSIRFVHAQSRSRTVEQGSRIRFSTEHFTTWNLELSRKNEEFSELFVSVEPYKYDLRDSLSFRKPTQLRSQLPTGSLTPLDKEIFERERASRTPNQVIFDEKHVFDDLEASRAYELIGMDPRDEANRAILFGLKHLEKLKHKHVQEKMRMHLFRPFRLLQGVENYAPIVKRIALFIEEGLNHYFQSEDLATCLFIAKLGADIKNHLVACGLGEAANALVDTRELMLAKYAQLTGTNTEKKVAFWNGLVKCYATVEMETVIPDQTPFLIQIAQDLFSLKIEMRKGVISSLLDEYQEMRELEMRLMPFIQRLLQDNTFARNAILNFMIKQSDQTFNDQVWGKGIGTYLCEKYEVDLARLRIFARGEGAVDAELADLPVEVLNDPVYAGICKGAVACVTHLGNFVFKVELANGETYELSYHKHHPQKVQIQAEWNGVIYQYLPEQQTEAIREQYPSLFQSHRPGRFESTDESSLPLLAADGKTCWISCENTIQRSLLIVTGRTLHNVDPAQAELSTIEWVEQGASSSLTDGFIQGLSSNQLVSSTIRKRSLEGKNLEMVSFSKVSEAFPFLLDLEPDPKWIECWKESGKEHLHQICLPNHNLRFTVRQIQGRQRAVSHEYPGYFIAENWSVPTLPKGMQCLVLENRHGDKKVLIQRVSLQKEWIQGPPLMPIVCPGEPLSKKRSDQWIEYGLHQGNLISSQSDANLYLCLMRVAEGDYSQVREVMRKVYPLARFSQEEESTLRNILHLLQRNPHPSATALLLSLVVKVYKNRLKYPLPVGEKEESFVSISALSALYRKYCQDQGNTTCHRLSLREEQIILDCMEAALENDEERAKAIQSVQEKATALKALKEMKSSLSLYTGNRKRYLAGSKAKIRTLPIPEQTEPPEEVKVTPGRLVEKFKDERISRDILDRSVCFFDGAPLSKHLFSFYKIAREGTAEQKQKLRKLLDLNSSIREGTHLVYWQILDAVLRKPNKFPKFTALQGAVCTFSELQDAFKSMRNSERYIRMRRRGREVLQESPQFKLLQTKMTQARKARDALFRKVASGRKTFSLFERIKRIVLLILFGKYSFILGRYSFKTLIQFVWKNWIAKSVRKKEKSLPNSTTPLIFPTHHGLSVAEIDKAFNGYFATLSQGYLVRDTHVTSKTDSVSLPYAHPDPVVEKVLMEQREKLAEFYETRPPSKQVFSMKPQHLPHLKEDLEAIGAFWKGRLNVQKQQLLWQVNQIPGGVEGQTIETIRSEGLRERISWQQLHRMVLEGNLETFQEKTHLGKEEAERVFIGVAHMLVVASRLQQAETALNVIQELEKQKGNLAKAALLVQQLGETLELVRNYTPSETTLSSMWFEYVNRYLYRKEQLEKITELLATPAKEVQAQMPTGYGKTQTIAPTLNQEKALHHLVFNIHPHTLEMPNTRDMRRQMDSYAKKIDRLAFDRTTGFTSRSLGFLYQELKKDFLHGRPVNMRSEALRSLELHFIDTLDRIDRGHPQKKELMKQAEAFLKILRLIRVMSWGTIDESHMSIHPKDKLIYTVNEPSRLPTWHVKLIDTVFVQLAKPKYRSALRIHENKQAEVGQEVRAPIFREIALSFAERYSIPESLQESFLAFVLGTSGEIPNWFASHAKAKKIALLKGIFTTILETSLEGYVDRNFGLSHQHESEVGYAIPYRGSNTPKETEHKASQYKNPHETLVKTYLTYLHKGLSLEKVKKLVDFLKEQMRMEADEGEAYGSTHANQDFIALMPEGYSKPLLTLTEEDIQGIHLHLQRDPQALFYYIRHLVAPQIKIYPESFVSTTQNFRSQLASSLSLSATPQDTAAHGPSTQFIPMKGTTGQVTHLLLKKCASEEAIQVLDADTAEQCVEELFRKMKGNPRVRAALDIGAHYKGMPNPDVAEKIREIYQDDPTVTGVLYYDDKQKKFVVMDVETGTVHDLEGSELEPEQRITLYDMLRSTGSDLLQAVDAIAALNIGKDTTLKEAGQAMGRMRKIQGEQSVMPVISKEIAQLITGPDGTLDIMALLVYLLKNQAYVEGKNNADSQFLQIDDTIRRPLLDRVLGFEVEGPNPANGLPSEKVSVKEAVRNFRRFCRVFKGKETCDPIALYAAIPGETPTFDCLTSYLKNALARVKKMKGLSKKERAVVSGRLEQFPSMWEGMNLVPTMRLGDPKAATGVSCDVLQEVDQKVDLEVKTLASERKILRTPWKWNPELDLFSKGWEKPERPPHFFVRLARKIVQIEQRLRNKIKEKFKTSLPFKAAVIIATPLVALGAIGGGVLLVIASIAQPIIAIVAAVLAAALVGGYFVNRLISGPKKYCPLYRVSDVMAAHLPKRVKPASSFFGRNLLVSNNFYMQRMKTYSEERQAPFTREQKPLFHILVIQDEEGKKKRLQAIVIDQNDSEYFYKRLEGDAQTPEEETRSRTRKVAIYDIEGKGINIQGKNGFAEGELESNRHFQDLLVEAEALNATVRYKPEVHHRRFLRKAEAVGQEAMMRFYTEALKPHPRQQRCFARSRVYKDLR